MDIDTEKKDAKAKSETKKAPARKKATRARSKKEKEIETQGDEQEASKSSSETKKEAAEGEAKKEAEKKGADAMEVEVDSEDAAPPLRPLNIKDFKKALNEVSASTSEDALSISELRKWNELYGEGGNRRKSALSYYM